MRRLERTSGGGKGNSRISCIWALKLIAEFAICSVLVGPPVHLHVLIGGRNAADSPTDTLLSTKARTVSDSILYYLSFLFTLLLS